MRRSMLSWKPMVSNLGNALKGCGEWASGLLDVKAVVGKGSTV